MGTVVRDRSVYLFVYGTLRAGSGVEAARGLHARGRLVGRGSIGARGLDLVAYPGAVPSDDPADRVVGEVWAIGAGDQADLLRLLDDYEGCTPGPDALFRRALADVRGEDGRTRRAWVYYWAGPVPAAGAGPTRVTAARRRGPRPRRAGPSRR